jgi:hypothetical protein
VAVCNKKKKKNPPNDDAQNVGLLLNITQEVQRHVEDEDDGKLDLMKDEMQVQGARWEMSPSICCCLLLPGLRLLGDRLAVLSFLICSDLSF